MLRILIGGTPKQPLQYAEKRENEKKGKDGKVVFSSFGKFGISERTKKLDQ